jgi:hypothetical protein
VACPGLRKRIEPVDVDCAGNQRLREEALEYLFHRGTCIAARQRGLLQNDGRRALVKVRFA